ILNVPEAGILGIGTIRKVLTRDAKGEIQEAAIMDISLTLDHRLIDGAQGALFLRELTDILTQSLSDIVPSA
ncbi:MAG: 2-oxo acid dehydrogenase subunit E2, partial [Salinispira sp.]